ncbi:MAG: magnesium transporter CorA family protein [Myxococcota bacterium]
MKTTCLEILPDKTVAVAPADLVRRWREGAQALVMLEGGTADERREWLSNVGAGPAFVDLILQTGQPPRLVLRDDAVLFELPGTASTETPEAVPVSFVCFERLVVVLADRPVAGFEQLFQAGGDAGRTRVGTPGFAVAVMLLFLSAALRTMVANVRAQVREVARRMDTSSDSVSLLDITRLKRLHLDADAIVEEALATMDLVKISRRKQLDLVEHADLMNAALSHVNAAERRLDRVDRTIDHLQDRYEAGQQEKMNRRLGVLTVLSAIFMPLTLMAGVWGMNFRLMPELERAWGYPAALGLMIGVAGALFWWFRSRGWLR